MLNWAGKYQKLTKEITENSHDEALDIVPKLLGIYVDDTLNINKILPKGARFVGEEKKIIIDEEQKIKDEESEITDERRSMNILVEVANSIDKDIVMSGDVPSDFENGKLPFLDTQMWMEGPKVLFKFYTKPMSSRTV